VNEWQPFWQTLKERIVSFSRSYLTEKKADKGSLSRFWPSSNSAKSDSSTSSSQTPLPDYESEALPVAPPSKRVQAKPKTKAVASDASDASTRARVEPAPAPAAYRLRPSAKLRTRRRQFKPAIVPEPDHVSAQPYATWKLNESLKPFYLPPGRR